MDTENGTPYDRLQRLARLVRQLRMQRNLSQSAVARRGGFGPSTLSQLERVIDGGPMIGLPTPDTLRAIARGLATDWQGNRDCEAVKQLHADLMTAVGYCDLPSPTIVTIPRAVLEKLAELSDADIEIGLTGRPWTDVDTANVLRALDEELRQKRARAAG